MSAGAGEQAFWQPWMPKVGDWVKIRRSAECPHGGSTLHALSQPDGSVGQVYQIFQETWGEPTDDGHDVFVGFNADDDANRDGGYFATVELDPAPSLAAAGPAGEGAS